MKDALCLLPLITATVVDELQRAWESTPSDRRVTAGSASCRTTIEAALLTWGFRDISRWIIEEGFGGLVPARFRDMCGMPMGLGDLDSRSQACTVADGGASVLVKMREVAGGLVEITASWECCEQAQAAAGG